MDYRYIVVLADLFLIQKMSRQQSLGKYLTVEQPYQFNQIKNEFLLMKWDGTRRLILADEDVLLGDKFLLKFQLRR